MAARCSFCGSTTGPFSQIEGLFTVLMCADCQATRGHGTGPYHVMTRTQMRAGLDLLPTWVLEQKPGAGSATAPFAPAEPEPRLVTAVRYRLRLAVAAAKSTPTAALLRESRTTRPFQQRTDRGSRAGMAPTPAAYPSPQGRATLAGRWCPLGLDPTGHAGYY